MPHMAAVMPNNHNEHPMVPTSMGMIPENVNRDPSLTEALYQAAQKYTFYIQKAHEAQKMYWELMAKTDNAENEENGHMRPNHEVDNSEQHHTEQPVLNAAQDHQKWLSAVQMLANNGTPNAEKAPSSSGKLFACSVEGCDAVYNSRIELQQHKRVHQAAEEAEAKNFKCAYGNCQKTFATLSGLRQHAKSHVEEKQYVCQHPGCGKKFLKMAKLHRHELTHSPDDMPFRCDDVDCGKAYATRYELNLHIIRKHHITKPHPCPYPRCGKGFPTLAELKRHYKRHCKSPAGEAPKVPATA